jgi:hypothetical protein
MLIVEVCQGPDCTGLGGGAALLEIEELIQEKQNGERRSLCLVEGGCRDFCTVGPNVHIRHRKHGSIESFNHVSDSSKCDLAVQNAVVLEASVGKSDKQTITIGVMGVMGLPKSSKSPGSHQSMMARRAGRMRWESLRNISRTLAKCKKDINNESNILDDSEKCQRKMNSLKEGMLKALSSSSGAELSDRAERRRERLSKNISIRLEKCFEEEYSDDDSSDESSD